MIASGQSTVRSTVAATHVIAATVCLGTDSGEGCATIVFDQETVDATCDESLGILAAVTDRWQPRCGSRRGGIEMHRPNDRPVGSELLTVCYTPSVDC